MTGPNISTAVRQRRVEPLTSLDDFPTPPWATRALCEWLTDAGHMMPTMTVREPAANRGYMARPLAEYLARVEASDVYDYGVGYPVDDYLFGPAPHAVDWTITNPPFRLAGEFIARARATSTKGVAVIVRSAFLEGQDRYNALFKTAPPSWVLQHTERVPMVKGRYDPRQSTATAYCWLLWMPGHVDTKLGWLAPCRKLLERLPQDSVTE